MTILRRFTQESAPLAAPMHIHVQETDIPDRVCIYIGDDFQEANSIILTADQFKELANLAAYSTYGDSVRYVPGEAESDD